MQSVIVVYHVVALKPSYSTIFDTNHEKRMDWNIILLGLLSSRAKNVNHRTKRPNKHTSLNPTLLPSPSQPQVKVALIRVKCEDKAVHDYLSKSICKRKLVQIYFCSITNAPLLLPTLLTTFSVVAA